MGKFSKPAIQPQVRPQPRPLERQIARQISGIAGLSVVLGLLFNASNPLGIRWSKATAPAAAPIVAVDSVAGNSVADKNPAKAAAPNVPPLPMPTTVSTGASGQTAPTPATLVQQPVAPATQPTALGNPASAVTAANNSLTPTTLTPTTNSTPTSPLPPPPLALPISWAEAKPVVSEGRALLIDARHRPNFEAGHIPGAISLPFTSSIEELEAFQKKYSPETRLVVYCSNPGCALSKRLAEQLVNQYRFQNVQYMVGGFQEWQRSELATPKPGT